MKNKLRVILLGGSGFIGKNILEKLSTKYKFIAPTHQELDLLNEKVVEKFLKKFKPDVIIYSVNLGGTKETTDTAQIFADNLQMFFTVVRCKKYFKKMIFLGSGAEYDKRNALVKVKENDFDKSIPVDYYGLYKYICSKYIENSKNIVCLRIFGLFGKYEEYTIRFISNAVCKHLFNLPITINQNVYFDYVFIDDFIRILNHFILYESKHKTYNIGTGQKRDLLSIAKCINNISEKKQKIIVKNPGLGNEYTCDNTRLMKEIKHFSFTPFDDSLLSLYIFYKQNKMGLKFT